LQSVFTYSPKLEFTQIGLVYYALKISLILISILDFKFKYKRNFSIIYFADYS